MDAEISDAFCDIQSRRKDFLAPYPVPIDKFMRMEAKMQEIREAEGKPFLCANLNRPNFLLGGVPVVIEEK